MSATYEQGITEVAEILDSEDTEHNKILRITDLIVNEFGED